MVATAESFDIQVISLRCVASARLAGDVMVLRLNRHTLWSSGKRRMHAKPTKRHQVEQFDFANGKNHTDADPEIIKSTAVDALVFHNPGPDLQLELREHRFLIGDSILGRLRVSIGDTEHGAITVMFANGGARYALTYRVVRGS